jgi:cytochrome c556
MACRLTLGSLALVGLCVASASAQARPYDAIMKEMGTTAGAMRKSLEGGALAAAATDAERLQGLLQETEAFWARFRTKDAIEAARGARDAATTIAAAAVANDKAKATTAAASLSRYCTACHDSHRELAPDKSYRIRP